MSVDDPTGWKAAEALNGFIEDAPADMADREERPPRVAVVHADRRRQT